MRVLASVVLLAAVGMAQRGSVGEDELQAEVTRRQLLNLPRNEVPVSGLIDQLSSADADVAWRAGSVLAHHRLATDHIAGLVDHGDRRLRLLAIEFAGEAELVELVDLAREEPALRRRALFALEDLRGLTDEELVAALADPEKDVSDAASVVVLYERVPITPGLLDLVRRQVPARRALLAGLARKQRRDCDAWIEEMWESGSLDRVERLHAIAALPGEKLTQAMAREVLDAGDMDSVGSDAAYRAAANLPANLADGLISEVHLRCEQGADVEEFLHCLGNVSPGGEEHLLAVASRLDGETRESISIWLVARGSPGLRERVRAALDGEIPLELHLLGRAKELLDRPERIQRVVAKLVEGNQAEQIKAFDVLVRAGLYDDAMLDYALANRDPRGLRSLAGLPAGRVPDAALLHLLQSDDTSVVGYACQAAAKRPLSPEVERVVLDLARAEYPQDLVVAATRTLMLAGSERGVKELWPRLRGDPDLHIDGVAWLTERENPWVHELLLEALVREESRARPVEVQESRRTEREDQRVDEFLRMALARIGDRNRFEELVANAAQRSAWFLRQCRSFVVDRISAVHVALIAAQLQGEDVPESVRIELVNWLGLRPDLGVEDTLARLAVEDVSQWVRMEALRGLLSGPRREALQAELFGAMTGPLDEGQAELAYEIVGSARAPLTEQDLELMARLVLQAPLARPEEEARTDLSFYSPRAGFPLLILVVDQLRRDSQARPGAAFAKVADEVLAGEGVGMLSRRRCLSLLMQSCLDPRVRAEVGPPVARLLLAIPERQGRGAGHLLLAEQADALGEFRVAAKHFGQAARSMLRDPDPLGTVRVFLGDRDAARGVHPLAALAAGGPIASARADLEDGDRESAARRLAVAAELAVGDHESEQEVLRLQTELRR